MAQCDHRTYVYANLELTIQLNRNGNVAIPQTQVTLPEFPLNNQPPPPTGMRVVSQIVQRTNVDETAGTIDVGVPIVGPSFTGRISTKLSLRLSSTLYADEPGPYCVIWKASGFESSSLFEGPLGLDLAEGSYQFSDLTAGSSCPGAKICEDTIDLEWDYEHRLLSLVEMELEGECQLHYAIYRVTDEKKEKAAGNYKEVGQLSNGSYRYALARESVRVKVPLPESLGGKELWIEEAEGYVVVAPGAVRDGKQRLQVEALHLTAPSVKLPDGRSSGTNHILLAPGRESHGTLDLSTGELSLALHEIIFNDLFALDAPIRVHSRVAGLYDFRDREADVVGHAVDLFPEDAPPPKQIQQVSKEDDDDA